MEKNDDLALLKQRLKRLEKAQSAMSTAAGVAIRENRYLRQELCQVYTSNSWRLMAPLRKITDIIHKLKG